jgi:hypothetical protein
VSTHTHHDKQHDDIGHCLETLTWLIPERRRHAVRQTSWRISDHLRCCHGLRRVGRKTIRELIDMHALCHAVARVLQS